MYAVQQAAVHVVGIMRLACWLLDMLFRMRTALLCLSCEQIALDSMALPRLLSYIHYICQIAFGTMYICSCARTATSGLHNTRLASELSVCASCPAAARRRWTWTWTSWTRTSTA